MKTRAIRLDFVSAPRPAAIAGRMLAGVGIIALCVSGLAVQSLDGQVAERDAQLAARSTKLKAETAHAGSGKDSAADLASFAPELAAPWSALLTELENAARDHRGRIAVLAVEPDRQKKIVRVRGQARTMALVLAFVQRLGASPLLAHPMLDSHETRVEEAEHPIEFQVSAEWVQHS